MKTLCIWCMKCREYVNARVLTMGQFWIIVLCKCGMKYRVDKETNDVTIIESD